MLLGRLMWSKRLRRLRRSKRLRRWSRTNRWRKLLRLSRLMNTRLVFVGILLMAIQFNKIVCLEWALAALDKAPLFINANRNCGLGVETDPHR